jgi:hypothetical protein
MGCDASGAKQDLNGILPANALVSDRHEIVAHRMGPQIEDRDQAAIPADFTD